MESVGKVAGSAFRIRQTISPGGTFRHSGGFTPEPKNIAGGRLESYRTQTDRERRNVSRTKAINMKGAPMRGGIRL